MFLPSVPVENRPLVTNPVEQPTSPGTHNVPSGLTLGRSVCAVWSLFVSTLERMLNGRPDDHSKIGAIVKFENTRLQPSPPLHEAGATHAPLNTNRCR